MPRGESALTQPRSRGGRFSKVEGRRSRPNWMERAAALQVELTRQQDTAADQAYEQQQAHDRRVRSIKADQALELRRLEEEHARALMLAERAFAEQQDAATAALARQVKEFADALVHYRDIAESRAAEITDLHDQLASAEETCTKYKRRWRANCIVVATRQLQEQKKAAALRREQQRHLATKQKLHDALDTVKAIRDDMDALEEREAAADFPSPPASSPTGGPPPAVRRPRLCQGDAKDQRNVRRWRADVARLLSSQYGPDQLAAAVAAVNDQVNGQGARMKAALARLSSADAKEFLAPGVVCALKKEGAEELVAAMQRHWDVHRSATLRYYNGLSRRKYDDVRRRLSSIWEKEPAGGWVRACCPNGVPFPQLASRHKVEQYAADIRDDCGVNVFADGRGVECDLRAMLADVVCDSLDSGHFKIENSTALQANGDSPEVNFLIDAANHHRHVKITAAAALFPL